MAKSLLIAVLAAFLVCGPAMAHDKAKKRASKAKIEVGASCKAPAVGTCAACSIACRPGETAIFGGGQVAGDMCHLQPSCKCTK